jgi:hypothetical protein
MNKEFCTYEQALELAKLNFNEKCFGYYGIENKLHFEISSNLDSNLTRRNFLSAPLYSQAFRFFREKYDLPSHIATYWQHDWNNYSYQWYTVENHIEWNSIEHFKTYEEAEQACLDKLIEIVKTK